MIFRIAFIFQKLFILLDGVGFDNCDVDLSNISGGTAQALHMYFKFSNT